MFLKTKKKITYRFHKSTDHFLSVLYSKTVQLQIEEFILCLARESKFHILFNFYLIRLAFSFK